MKRFIKALLVLLILLPSIISSCAAPAKSIFTPWANSRPIQLTTGESKRSYTELGTIWAIGVSFEDINEELQNKAQEIHAHAIIRIAYDPRWRSAIGTAIRYTDSMTIQNK